MTSQTTTKQQIVTLMHTNLMEIFNSHSSSTRLSAMESTYAPDFIFYGTDQTYQEHDKIDAHVQEILDKFPDWVFKPAGPVSVNHDMGVLPWQFGPEGKEPVIKGRDVAVFEGGKMKCLWLFMEGTTEAE